MNIGKALVGTFWCIILSILNLQCYKTKMSGTRTIIFIATCRWVLNIMREWSHFLENAVDPKEIPHLLEMFYYKTQVYTIWGIIVST